MFMLNESAIWLQSKESQSPSTNLKNTPSHLVVQANHLDSG